MSDDIVKRVNFTVPPEGLLLKALGIVLPPGRYPGEMHFRRPEGSTSEWGRLHDAVITLDPSSSRALGIDGDIETRASVLQDYQAGLIREDREIER